MSPFTFSTRRSRKAQLDIPSLFDIDEPDETEEPGIINGQKARSILEWRVAKALWTLKRTFFYQYPIFGGTQVRGGYVVDFLIDAAPASIPLEVQGEHWHTGSFSSGELMRQAVIEDYLGTKLLYVWENELGSDEDALQAVKKEIGPG